MAKHERLQGSHGSRNRNTPQHLAIAPTFAIGNPDFNFRSLRGNAVFRWEFRPGSTLFLVWQQSRQGIEPIGDIALGGDLGEGFRNPATSVLALKMTYWLGA